MRLLRGRDFRSFWLGQSISLLGDQISYIALPLVAVLVLDAGPAQMGYLGAAALLPHLLLSLPAGVWLDRVARRRRILITCDLARAAVLITVPIAYGFDALTLGQLYSSPSWRGASRSSSTSPTRRSSSRSRPREQFIEGNSLVNGSRSFSYIAGPSLGGLLVQAFSAPFTILADAVSYSYRRCSSDGSRPPRPRSKNVEGGIRAASPRGSALSWRNEIFRPAFLRDGDAQLLQLRVQRALRPLRDPDARTSRRARSG